MSSKALVLRTCAADGTSSHGFTWPKEGMVECLDWNPEPICGGGLHGLLWGEGDWSLLQNEAEALWQVVEVEDVPANLVRIDKQKVKFKQGTVIFTGEMSKAVTMVLCHGKLFKKTLAEAKEKSSGNYSRAASSGNYSRAASSGDCSTAASSGDCSTAASSGGYSRAASSGGCSTAASSGDYSRAASSGGYSRAASSGDCSTAASEGEKTVAMVAGYNGQVKVGPSGAFAIAYFDTRKKRPRILVGHVGEKGVKANTWYHVKNGRLVKVK